MKLALAAVSIIGMMMGLAMARRLMPRWQRCWCGVIGGWSVVLAFYGAALW